MKRLSILLPVCMLVAPAYAAEQQEWYLLKTSDGAYAFDAQSVETDMGSGVKSVSILIGTRGGNTSVSYDIDCRKNRGQFTSSITADDEKKTEELSMTEGNSKTSDPGWSAIPKSGSMKVAAEVACEEHVADAVRVKNENTALAELKTLSK